MQFWLQDLSRSRPGATVRRAGTSPAAQLARLCSPLSRTCCATSTNTRAGRRSACTGSGRGRLNRPISPPLARLRPAAGRAHTAGARTARTRRSLFLVFSVVCSCGPRQHRTRRPRVTILLRSRPTSACASRAAAARPRFIRLEYKQRRACSALLRARSRRCART